MAALAVAGIGVVSGLARGVDRAAHAAALARGAWTGAVVGTGVDRIYPAEHASLYTALVTQGLVVSELAPGTGVRRAHFPSRNRLVAALSDAVVLVQADRGSGSAHTVRHALKLGRPVFVAPWPFAHDAYAGNADWVRRAPVGLRVLADPADVIDAATRQGRPDPAESALDRALTRSARTIDELARRAGVDVVHAARLLVRLELRGTVERAAGGYRRRSR